MRKIAIFVGHKDTNFFMLRYSIIVPVYNRPDEIGELVASLAAQNYDGEFELVVVEDGSSVKCRDVVMAYADRLTIKYIEKDNGGPAMARNFGAAQCEGEWLLILDSDCVLPSGWLAAIDEACGKGGFDAFGGPDRASANFSTVQKAINYSMTSFFTTGGIRGSKSSLEKFHPRSFNMGVRRSAFECVGGFAQMRFGEDIDFSMRLMEGGFRCVLLPDAWVYHKRRVDFRKFFRQVRASGTARVELARRHKGGLKIVHLLPVAFTLVMTACLLGALFCVYSLLLPALWAVIILIDSSIKNRSLAVGTVSIVSSFVQLTGYGLGFLWAALGGGRSAARNFYK